MHTTTSKNSRKRFIINFARNAALTLVAASAGLALHAQQSAPASPLQPPVQNQAQPTLNLQAYLQPAVDLSSPTSSSSNSEASSSSSTEAAATTAPDRFNLSYTDAAQPPPRRRYGNPHYSDRTHNADGSSKFAFNFGAGLTVPVNNSSNVFTPSYATQVGLGFNFSKNLGIMFEGGYDHFGLQGSAIAKQAAYYNTLNITDPTTGQQTDFSQLDANAHVWSFTVDPIFSIYQNQGLGAYIIAGGGYYHKAINFTLPQAGYYCDPYYGCVTIVQNQNFDTHYTNGGGFNGGMGLTFKLSRFSAAKLYTEARYVWTSGKLVQDGSPIGALDNTSTSYVPITFGIRW